MAEHVFVVDDEAPVRQSLGRLVAALGFEALTFASAEEFLAIYAGDNKGCLLLDLRMPGMSGVELIEELRRRHSSLPIIVMTGHTDYAAAANRLHSLGTLGFLEKPFPVDELQALLKRWLDDAV